MGSIIFNQVVSRGCGIDVHKKTVVATIDGEGLRKITKEFGTFTSSLKDLRNWLLENSITHVAMESTGVYWKPVYNILEPTGMIIWIVNARHVKYVPGHKTDKKDSSWLCKLLLAGLLKPSYIPPKQQRELRDLTRYRKKLIENIVSNKNRVIRVLEDCNIKLSSVLSDTSGVTGTKLIDLLIAGEEISRDVISEVYDNRLHTSKDDLFEACQGFMTENNIYLLQIIKRDIASTELLIVDVNVRIKDMLSIYENILELLKGVPGIGTKSAEDLVAEIGLDMNSFPNEKHLASWVGIAPGNNESAGKKKVDTLHMETNKQRQR